MEVWAWILAYVLGFALLQLLVYRYFGDGEASVEGSPSTSGDRYPGPTERLDGDRERADLDGDDTTVYCHHCGTHNERVATYRYCRQCLSPLQ